MKIVDILYSSIMTISSQNLFSIWLSQQYKRLDRGSVVINVLELAEYLFDAITRANLSFTIPKYAKIFYTEFLGCWLHIA